MKTLLLTLIFSGLVSSVNSQDFKFTIDAKIDGIEVGDTLRFSMVVLPQWKIESDFDIIVQTDNQAKYSGTLEH